MLSLCVEVFKVRLVLGDRTAAKRVRSVIRVWILRRLVLKAATQLLTAIDCVGLERMLVVKPLSVYVALTFHSDVK